MNTLQTIQVCQEKLHILHAMIPVAQHRQRLAEIDTLINEAKFWGDPRSAGIMMKERLKLSELLDKLRLFEETISFNSEFATTCPEEVETLAASAEDMLQAMSELEFQLMLSDPADDSPAILTISAGAGGLEAANWVTMLLRMYSRYADSYKFKVELLDMKPSEEHGAICTDSVSISVTGPYAFGFFKGESGVHRLIRHSPFNAGDARHTSFAAVSVTPDIEDTVDIKIEEKDLEITAQTAGGPGGQHQNKVASAVRIKHLPTGINILVRSQRDQHANRRTAMKMLKAKLYDLEMKKRKQEAEKHLAQQSDVSFGSQIRSYTLSPYRLVKDHRTGCETNDADAMLDGDVHEFLLAYLRWAGHK